MSKEIINSSPLTWENINPKFRDENPGLTLAELQEKENALLNLKVAVLMKNGIKESFTEDKAPAIPVRKGKVLEDLNSQIDYMLFGETRNNAGEWKEPDKEHFAESKELLKDTMYLTAESNDSEKYTTLAKIYGEMGRNPGLKTGSDLPAQIAVRMIAARAGLDIDYRKMNKASYDQWQKDGKSNNIPALTVEFYSICSSKEGRELKIEMLNPRDFERYKAQSLYGEKGIEIKAAGNTEDREKSGSISKESVEKAMRDIANRTNGSRKAVRQF